MSTSPNRRPAIFKVDDEVVYPPHGSGVVTAIEERDDAFGRYLSIRIVHSKMTLLVPESKAAERGVRPIMSAAEADAVIASIAGEAGELAATPQMRARVTADAERAGSPEGLAATIRDYGAKVAGGGKLSMPERKAVDTATRILASEIALAKGIELAEAESLLDGTT